MVNTIMDKSNYLNIMMLAIVPSRYNLLQAKVKLLKWQQGSLEAWEFMVSAVQHKLYL